VTISSLGITVGDEFTVIISKPKE